MVISLYSIRLLSLSFPFNNMSSCEWNAKQEHNIGFKEELSFGFKKISFSFFFSLKETLVQEQYWFVNADSCSSFIPSFILLFFLLTFLSSCESFITSFLWLANICCDKSCRLKPGHYFGFFLYNNGFSLSSFFLSLISFLFQLFFFVSFFRFFHS